MPRPRNASLKPCAEAVALGPEVATPLASGAARRSPPPRGRRSHIWLFACLLAFGPEALAQPTSTVGAPSPRTAKVPTELQVRTSAANFERLQAVIGRNSLGTLQLRWFRLQHLSASTFLDAERGSPSQVRCFIDLSHPTKAALYFADGNSKRFLYRELPIARGYDPVELETLAQIVELGVGALLDESTATLSRVEAEALLGPDDEAPSSSPETAAPRSRAEDPKPSGASPPNREAAPPQVKTRYLGAFDVAAAFESRLRDQGLGTSVVAGAGLRIDQGASSFRFGARTAYLMPQTVTGPWVNPTLDGYRVLSTLVGEKALTNERRLFAGLGLMLGLERLHVRPRQGTLDESTELSGPSWATIPIIVPSFHVEYRWGKHLVTAVDASLTVATRVITYQLQLPSDVLVEIVQTRAVRPAFQLSVGWN